MTHPAPCRVRKSAAPHALPRASRPARGHARTLTERAFAPSLVVAVLLGAPAAAAPQLPSINVDFDLFASSTAEATEGGAALAPGEWNSLDITGAAGSVYVAGALVEATGQPTTVTLTGITQSAAQLRFLHHPVTSGPQLGAARLLSDICYVGGPCTWVFAGVPAGDYDLFTYAMAPEGLPNLTAVSVTGALQGTQVVGGNYGGAYAEALTHARHRVTVEGQGSTPGLGLVVVRTEPFSGYDSLAGFQLVPAGPGGLVGEAFCPGAQNSTGAAGTLHAIGRSEAASNDLVLQARDLPPQNLAMFALSLAAGPPIQSGEGQLCLGGDVSRFDRPGEVGLVDTFGAIELELDLGALPGPAGPFSAIAGDTLHFQVWHRDEVGGAATWNFTGGVRVSLD